VYRLVFFAFTDVSIVVKVNCLLFNIDSCDRDVDSQTVIIAKMMRILASVNICSIVSYFYMYFLSEVFERYVFGAD